MCRKLTVMYKIAEMLAILSVLCYNAIVARYE